MNNENQDASGPISRLSERINGLSERLSEDERDVRQLLDHRADAEARLRMIESELKKVGGEVSDLCNRLKVFEMNHNSRKENWNSVANFLIQLAWVAMAALLLTKLGLQAPL